MCANRQTAQSAILYKSAVHYRQLLFKSGPGEHPGSEKPDQAGRFPGTIRLDL